MGSEKIEFFNPGKLPDAITEDDLIANSYKSTPRNKAIADVFRTMGLIEKYGSGIGRIINYFKEENLPLPEFKLQGEGFLVTVYAAVNTYVVENVVEKRSQEILKLILRDKKISAKQISELLEITERTAQRDLENLKIMGFIKRVGPSKGGHWEVVR